MPLGEAHVHQLPVQVIEGRLGGTQPGTCLLLTGSRAPWRSTMTSVEKALEDEDRQMNPEEVLLELKLQPGDSGWVPPSPLAILQQGFLPRNNQSQDLRA